MYYCHSALQSNRVRERAHVREREIAGRREGKADRTKDQGRYCRVRWGEREGERGRGREYLRERER